MTDIPEMAYWSYRVCQTTFPSGEKRLAIHEVYFDTDDNPTSFTGPVGAEVFDETAIDLLLNKEGIDELRQVLDSMRRACEKEIIEIPYVSEEDV